MITDTMSKEIRKNTDPETGKGNVLYVIPYPRFFSQHKNVGGHVAHAYGITSELAAAGYRVHIILEEEISLIKGKGRMVTPVPLKNNTIVNRILWGKKLINEIEEAVKTAPPLFCYMRYSVGFQNWLPALKKALGDIPLILEVNSFGSQRRRWMSFYEGFFLDYADHLIVISEPVYKAFHKFFGEKITGKTIVVPNGVDPDRFMNWESNISRECGEVLKAGYAGMIESWYGLDDVIEGFLKVSQNNKFTSRLELHFYGEGPYRKKLENKYRNVENIVFHGAKPFEEMPEIIGELDILINSDSLQKSYGSPTKMFEYMSSGRPILSARTAQSEKLLDNGKFGWFYELGNPDSFAKAMDHLIQNFNQAKDKAKEARKHVEKNHTWKQRLNYIFVNFDLPVDQQVK